MAKSKNFPTMYLEVDNSFKAIRKVVPNHIRIILYRSPLPKILDIFRGGYTVQNPEPSGAYGGLLFGRVTVLKLYRISINIQFIVNNSFL